MLAKRILFSLALPFIAMLAASAYAVAVAHSAPGRVSLTQRFPARTDSYQVLLPAVFTYSPVFTRTRVILPGTEVIDVLFEPDEPTHGYAYAAAPTNALLETVDGGQVWTPLPDTYLGVNRVIMHPITHSILYGTNSGGVYESTDAGRHWARQPYYFYCPVGTIAAHPVSPTVLLVGTQNWEPWGGYMFRSGDGGQNWYLVAWQFVNARVFAFSPTNPSVVYAGGLSPSILKSTDGGLSWYVPSGGTIYQSVYDLMTIAESPSQIYEAGEGGIFRSDDAGEHWQALWTEGHVWTLARNPTNPLNLYAGTRDGILVSYNGGGDWYPLGTCASGARVRRLAFAPSTPDVLWAATDNGLWECRR